MKFFFVSIFFSFFILSAIQKPIETNSSLVSKKSNSVNNYTFFSTIKNCLQVHYEFSDSINLKIDKTIFYIQNLPILFSTINKSGNKYYFSYNDTTKNEFLIKHNSFVGKFKEYKINSNTNEFSYFGLATDKFIFYKMSASVFLSINFKFLNERKTLFHVNLIVFTDSHITQTILSSKLISKIVINKIKDEIKIGKLLQPKNME